MSIELTTEAELLRASHTARWGIVHTAVDQNIAEHMYRVWLLVYQWGPIAGLTEAEQQDAELLALIHDLPEIRTGDAPTPHKTSELKEHLSKMEAEILPRLAMLQERLPARVRDLVKFCDTAESILFLHVNGLGKHAGGVCLLLEDQMFDRLSRSELNLENCVALTHRFNATKSDT